MADAYERARDEFISVMEKITTSFALPALSGRIFGLLAFTPRPMNLDEIADALQVAKSGVSVNIRMLENFGMVRRVWVKGDRRDYYEADFDLVRLYHDFFKKGAELELGPTFDGIEKCLTILDGEIDPANREEAGKIRQRLERNVRIKEPLLALFERFVAALAELKTITEGGE